VPAAESAGHSHRLVADVGARRAADDEGRRRGLGPVGCTRRGLDARVGRDGAESLPVSGFVTLDGVRKRWSATVTVGPLSFGVAQGEILRSEEHTSELQSPDHLVCRLLLEKKKKRKTQNKNR